MQGSGTENKMSREIDLMFIGLLFAWAFFVNRGIRISGLYMDDLYMWSCYGEQNFFQYVFPLGSTRCRFVYWFFAWLELGFIRNHIAWIVPINIILNASLAAGIYFFSKRLSRSRIVAFLCGILFLTSRFSYYQIGQLLGLMETMGIFFAVGMCFFLYRELHSEEPGSSQEKKEKPYFYLALLFYFLNCFTHERYMVLLPMLFFVLWIKKEKNIRKWLSPVFTFAAVLLLRRIFTGTFSPAGTGGTTVADTITKEGVFQNFYTEFLYVLGINHGPEYLNGVPWHMTPLIFKMLVILSAAMLLAFLLCCVFSFRNKNFGNKNAGNKNAGNKKKPAGENTEKNKENEDFPAGKMSADILLFAGFMIGCAASAAVTIRVEMRWVYVIYAFGLLLISYLFGRIRMHSVPLILLLFSFCLIFPAELFYRTNYPNIYLFPNQKRYNSLADETYGKYGDDIFGKHIIIIGNSYQMSDFTADTFFKTFDPKRTAEGTTVSHVNSILDFGQVTDNMLILKEDAAHDLFTDVTDVVRSVKLGIKFGYYRDGWMDKNAEINVMTGDTGTIDLQFLYPGNLAGNERTVIIQDKGEPRVISITANKTDVTLQAVPHKIVNLQFSSNYIMPNAREIRGAEPLSVIVNITAD